MGCWFKSFDGLAITDGLRYFGVSRNGGIPTYGSCNSLDSDCERGGTGLFFMVTI